MCAKQKKDEEAIFNEAIKIKDSAERAAFIKSACGDDTELLARVEALLRVHYEDKSFLKSPPVDMDGTLDTPPLTEGPGTRIGRYKLLQLIGEGGFGAVYMAEQEKPIRRRVALKIIKLGMDTKQVIARFEAERQALAMMDHANIARVFDAGATDTGRPYFVMELVKGIPITEYCDKNNLDTRQRLDLFIDVCKAVQHAHQKGIIHRDIKPSNVMITLHDGKPVPKIIDFGIAKATQHRLTEKTFFTEYKQFIGTPEYMSPEQAEMSGLDVDTRSDIYSLGVLLYELLTGTTPFEPEKLRSAAYDEIRRIIREDEPPKPSTRLSSLGDALSDVAKHRHVQPDQLCKIVRGDLDWVVMRALEKNRTRRYETANEFAGDIERHLGDEPVIAGPPSVGYRMKKFVRRNRALVTSIATVLVVLVAGIVVSTIFAIGQARARAEADRARTAEAEQRQITEAERDRAVEAERLAEQRHGEAVAAREEAERQANISLAVIDFLTKDVLGKAKGKQSVEEVLDAASENLEGKFEGAPLVEASIREALGLSYQSMGKYEAAKVHLGRALAIRREQLGEIHPSTRHSAESLFDLYDLEYVDYLKSQVDKMATVFDANKLKALRFSKGENDPTTLSYMGTLAFVYSLQGRYDEAEALYIKALEGKRRVLGEEHPDTLRSMRDLAQLYYEKERYDEAEPLYVEMLEIQRRVLGDEDPNTLRSMDYLIWLYKKQGRYDKKEPLYVEKLEIQRRVLGEEDPNTLKSMSMYYLARLYEKQGRYDEAEALLVKVLEIQRRVLGDLEIQTLWTANRLVALYSKRGRYDKVEALEALFVRNLDTKRRVLGDEHWDTLFSMAQLSGLYRKQSRYDEAEEMLVKAVETSRRVLGEDDAGTRLLMESLIELYEAWGKPKKAEQWRAKLPSKEGIEE